MTTLHEELQGNNVTVATSGDPSSAWLARIEQGCIALGMNVTAANPAPEGLKSDFNHAHAGIQAQGAQLVAAGTQAAPAPTVPEQPAAASPSMNTLGMG